MRIGHGYDAHRFASGRKLFLGGVEIPYEKGLLGHSDADVLLHALSDALLGAAGRGDIGMLFPDNDPQTENISSRLILEAVIDEIHKCGFAPVNCDCTVIAQKPKLSPYIASMRKTIAECLGLPAEGVNIKATTEERMGFTGREEGISAHAVVLLQETES